MLYAVFRTGGKQYRVSEGDHIRIEKLHGDVGAEVVFSEVLMIGGERPVIGHPLVNGAKVVGKIVDQDKDKKIIVFKFRRRKNYRRKYGHRQPFTEVVVTRLQSGASA